MRGLMGSFRKSLYFTVIIIMLIFTDSFRIPLRQSQPTTAQALVSTPRLAITLRGVSACRTPCVRVSPAFKTSAGVRPPRRE